MKLSLPRPALILALSGVVALPFSPVFAKERAAPDISVQGAWVRGTVPQQRASSLFMDLSSKTGLRVVSIASPVARDVEVHEMFKDGDIMAMRELPKGLLLPPGKTVKLTPGGTHVMLMGLKQTLKAGDEIPFTMVLKSPNGRQRSLSFTAPVRALGAPEPK